MSDAPPNVQILNNSTYVMLSTWEVQLSRMLANMDQVYAMNKIDGRLAQGIETHVKLTAVTLRSAMKQMRGES